MFIISLEGIDGAGKSMCIEALRARFAGHERIVFYKEPCALSPLWDEVARLKLFSIEPCASLSDAVTLILQARQESFCNLEREYTEKNGTGTSDKLIVICDRATDSTIAYQSAVYNHDCYDALHLVADLYHKVFERAPYSKIHRVDRALWLRCDVKSAIERIENRDGRLKKGDRYNLGNLLKLVDYNYLKLSQIYSLERMTCIEAVQSLTAKELINKVISQIQRAILHVRDS